MASCPSAPPLPFANRLAPEELSSAVKERGLGSRSEVPRPRGLGVTPRVI
jgi:hypothetical protein